MARTVKCYICKKDLNKEDAYMFTYTSQSGKEYRKYACSLEEIENDKRQGIITCFRNDLEKNLDIEYDDIKTI